MKRCSGFTLIEVVLTILIIGIALVPIMNAFFNTTSRSVQTQQATLSTLLAQELLEEMRIRRFDENTSPPYSPSPLGPDPGETRATYDDISDYNGLSEAPSGFSGFLRTCTVQYVNPDALDTPVPGPTNYKRITVTVTPTGPEGSGPVTVVILRSAH